MDVSGYIMRLLLLRALSQFVLLAQNLRFDRGDMETDHSYIRHQWTVLLNLIQTVPRPRRVHRQQRTTDFVLELLQVVDAQLQAPLGGAEGHPLQHHLVPLQPVADGLLQHYGAETTR